MRARNWSRCSPGIPDVRLTPAMSSSADSAARPLPRLARIWDGQVEPLESRRGSRRDATSCSSRCRRAPPPSSRRRCVDAGVRVIDLSGAFRLRDDARAHAVVSGDARRCRPASAYGLTERYRGRRARRRGSSPIPGCYPTAALLALLPLAQRRPARRRAPTSSSTRSPASPAPARRRPSARTSRENHGSRRRLRRVRPSARRRDGAGARRAGHVRAAPGAARPRHPRDDLRAASRRARRPSRSPTPSSAAYADAPFVRLTGDALPEIKHVAHTNFCDIGWRLDAADAAGSSSCRASTTW